MSDYTVLLIAKVIVAGTLGFIGGLGITLLVIWIRGNRRPSRGSIDYGDDGWWRAGSKE